MGTKRWYFFFPERVSQGFFPASYIGRRPIKPVPRWKRMFRAFQNFCQTLKKTFLKKVRSIWKKSSKLFVDQKSHRTFSSKKSKNFRFRNFRIFDFPTFSIFRIFDFQNFRFSNFRFFFIINFFMDLWSDAGADAGADVWSPNRAESPPNTHTWHRGPTSWPKITKSDDVEENNHFGEKSMKIIGFSPKWWFFLHIVGFRKFSVKRRVRRAKYARCEAILLC